jgi:CzcA family heavy metal efflux pump
MWIVRLALQRPYTFIVAALLLLILGPLAIIRTPTDIFPNIDIPVVSIIFNYSGLSAEQMEKRITLTYERVLTTTVNDIEHIESQSLNGIAVIKVYFQPGAKIEMAVAQVTSVSQAVLKQLPVGITPPLVITFNASSVPLIQLGLSSDKLAEQDLNDVALNFLRTRLVTIPGAAIPYPFGGKSRQVMVDIDPSRLAALGLSPTDVVNAISAQNLILPSGTAKIGSTEFDIEPNGSPQTIAELNDLPVKAVNGTIVYLKDVASVRDGFAVQTNIVRQNGRRSALVSVFKNGNASTLSIVDNVRAALPVIATSLPADLKISPLFDQSVFVRASISGVVKEAVIAALLTAAMILLFLGSWRHTLIIAISIPLSILSSLIILSALGETINIMTLGGLALAVGILVDDATVTIENIDRNLEDGAHRSLNDAILEGAHQIAVPAFVSTLCICIVFVPMFFLGGTAKYLFVPLAKAVVFAMLASYVLSRTLVPTLVMYLLRGHEHEHAAGGEPRHIFGRLQRRFENGFTGLRDRYAGWLEAALRMRWRFVLIFLGACLASLLLVPFLGQDFFPDVDAGQLRLHVRAKTATRIEETAALCDRIEKSIREVIPAEELTGILDNIGLPYSGINLSYSNSGTIGTADAEILISLNAEKHGPSNRYKELLRARLAEEFPGVTFFFQPSDIVSQILNFGLSAPIDVQFVGRESDKNAIVARAVAEKIRAIPGAVDVRVWQQNDQPKLRLDIDRSKADLVGYTARDVANSLLIALSSSSQTAPAFWLNPVNGVSYQMATQTPQYRIDSLDALGNIPVTGSSGAAPQLLSNLSSITRGSGPAIATHYDIQPTIDVYAAVQGTDLGDVAAQVSKIVDEAREKLPKGSSVVIRGQVQTMRTSFLGLGVGLIFAIALVYLLIVVNFQSWSDPFIIITALPGAMAGIAWMLFLTHTTLSVPALMGAIMCIGVATANAILVVTFAKERLAETRDPFNSALEAGVTRLRPVIMTALAMIIGMIPMALGLGEGGEQNAPLGRAVIGGLLVATVATLFFVPAVFSILRGRTTRGEAAREKPQPQPEPALP